MTPVEGNKKSQKFITPIGVFNNIGFHFAFMNTFQKQYKKQNKRQKKSYV